LAEERSAGLCRRMQPISKPRLLKLLQIAPPDNAEAQAKASRAKREAIDRGRAVAGPQCARARGRGRAQPSRDSAFRQVQNI
jgi:hypothetical protein